MISATILVHPSVKCDTNNLSRRNTSWTVVRLIACSGVPDNALFRSSPNVLAHIPVAVAYYLHDCYWSDPKASVPHVWKNANYDVAVPVFLVTITHF